MKDLYIAQLQYEILNASLDNLAKDLGVPLPLLQQEASIHNWKQWWPPHRSFLPLLQQEPETEPEQHLSSAPTHSQADIDEDNSFEEEADSYIKEQRARLQVFNLAKETYLAHKYAAVEARLLDRLHGIADLIDNPLDIKNLVSALKDLPGKVASGAGIKFGQDDTGMPTLIIKDLSGRG